MRCVQTHSETTDVWTYYEDDDEGDLLASSDGRPWLHEKPNNEGHECPLSLCARSQGEKSYTEVAFVLTMRCDCLRRYGRRSHGRMRD